VTYGDNNKERILGRDSIGDKNNLLIHDVLYVKDLKHNLLSISQLCDKGYQVIFKPNSSEICLPNTKEVMLVENLILDKGFWKNILNCLRGVLPPD